jgi:16S rRNA processing protein RimM
MEIPDLDNCFYFGKILRTHGYKGGLKAVLEVDDPLAYRGIEWVLVEMKKKLLPFIVENIHFEKNKANIKFQDVDTMDQAERFVHAKLYLPLELLPKLKGNKFYFHEIAGFLVRDEKHGDIGNISRVIELPNNPLLCIDHGGTEVLIPIADDIILKVDRRAKLLHIKAPEGLIELYLK